MCASDFVLRDTHFRRGRIVMRIINLNWCFISDCIWITFILNPRQIRNVRFQKQYQNSWIHRPPPQSRYLVNLRTHIHFILRTCSGIYINTRKIYLDCNENVNIIQKHLLRLYNSVIVIHHAIIMTELAMICHIVLLVQSFEVWLLYGLYIILPHFNAPP